MCRFLTLLQKGETDRADEALAQNARAAHHSKVPEAIWHAERLLATRALARGEFDRAERTFQELENRRRQLDFGYESMFLGPQVFVLLRERGDLKFLNPPVGKEWPKRAAHDAAGVPRMYEIAFVAPLVKNGRETEARAIFEGAASCRFKNIPKNASYLWMMVECAEAALALRDRARAELIFSLLEPYGEFNAVHVHGFSMGAVWHYLGRLAIVLERSEEAQTLLKRAIERNARTGQPAFAARSRYLLARLLRRSDHKGQRGREDRKQAAQLLTSVLPVARSLGMTPLQTSAERLWSELDAGASDAEA